jgi:hypothetical protein
MTASGDIRTDREHGHRQPNHHQRSTGLFSHLTNYLSDVKHA